jgi:signal transduction histidine kinase/CheY-like chemotaxis protein
MRRNLQWLPAISGALILLAGGLMVQSPKFVHGHEFSLPSRESVTERSVLQLFRKSNQLRQKGSLESAFSVSLEALEKAKLTSNERLIFVASAQVEAIDALVTGRPIILDEHSPLLEDASPELQLYYYSGLIQSKIWFQSRGTDFETLIRNYEDAALGSTDAALVDQQKSLSLLVRVTCLGQRLESTEVAAGRKSIRGNNEDAKFLLGPTIDSYLGTLDPKLRKKPNARIELLEQTRALAENNVGWMTIRCNQNLAHVYLGKGDFDNARGNFVKALDQAKAIGSAKIALTLHTEMSVLERIAGRPQEAALHIKQAEQISALAWLSQSSQELFHRHAYWVFSELKDVAHQERILKWSLDPNELEIVKANEKLADFKARQLAQSNAELYQSDDENDKLSKQLETTSELASELEESAEQANHSIQYLRWLSIGLAILVVVLIPWLITLALRARLHETMLNLTTEKEASRQSQQKCDELATRLNRLQRMESLGLMAGSVAHDFNNLLVGVIGHAEVIQLKNQKDNVNEDGFFKQQICSIIRSAEKAADLSRQMLAYAGKQSIARKPTDLNKAIVQFRSILESSCKGNQKLVLELDASPVVSKVDLTQLEQVLLNLATNAYEASGNDDTITIRTGTQTIAELSSDCSIFGTRATGGNFGFIEVEDSGSGISKSDLEFIFEPYFSNSQVGRGLGLSVVYGAVEGHDGLIQCCSMEGSGTSFRVLLPLGGEESEDSREDENFLAQSDFFDDSSSSLIQKILVIDDERTVLDLSAQLLRLNGWEVHTANGGEEGVKLAAELKDSLTCILLDVVMPEMGANEVLREMEVRGLETPVVLMSGFSQSRLEFFMERKNVASIVQKPFRAREIKTAILSVAKSSSHSGFAVSDGNRKPDLPR